MDPFNWPTLSRSDLMSLNVINNTNDLSHTKTQHYRPKTRGTSTNLQTDDIEGRYRSLKFDLQAQNPERGLATATEQSSSTLMLTSQAPLPDNSTSPSTSLSST